MPEHNTGPYGNQADELNLKLTEAEARWLRRLVGWIAERCDDSEAPELHRRLDALLHPEEYDQQR